MLKLQRFGVILLLAGLALGVYGSFEDPLAIPHQDFDQMPASEREQLVQSSNFHKGLGLFGLIALLSGCILFALASIFMDRTANSD